MYRISSLVILFAFLFIFACGCGSSNTYRGNYVESMSVSKDVAQTGELITISAVLGQDVNPTMWPKSLPSGIVTASAGTLYENMTDALDDTPIGPTTPALIRNNQPVILKLPDTAQDVIVTIICGGKPTTRTIEVRE